MVIFEDIMINKKNTKLDINVYKHFVNLKLQLENLNNKKILFTFYHKNFLHEK